MRTIPYIHAPLCLILAAFCSGSIQAQTVAGPTPSNSAPQTVGTARVNGRVVSTLGVPIPKASIRLIGQAGQQGNPRLQTFLEVSSSDGSFTFEGLPEGRYTTNAQKSGFSADPNSAATLNQITVSASETKNIEIKLSPLATISGRITDRDGDPVANVQIRLMRYGSQQGRTVLQQQNSANSDDRGQFRMVNIGPGRYYLSAEDLNSRIIGGTQEIRGVSAQNSNVTTYYPASTDTRNATRLDVKAGMQFDGVDIRMSRGQVFAVKGVVTDDRGTPIQAQVTVKVRNDMAPASIGMQASSAPGTGIFSIPAMPSGDYVLNVRSTTVARPLTLPSVSGVQPGPQAVQPQPVLFGSFDLSIRGANVEGLQLQLVAGSTLTGHVTLDGGGDLSKLVAGNRIQVSGPNGSVTQAQRSAPLIFTDVDGQNGSAVAQVQPDGTFSLSNISPSRYAVNISSLAPYLKSIRVGGQDITHQFLDLRSGAPGPVEITLGNKPGKITGVVTNGKGDPAVNAMVVLWPKTPVLSDSSGGVETVRTNATGNLTLDTLAPGEYYIAAFEDATQEYLRLPDYLAHFNASAKTVKLEEDGSETVEPKWINRETSDKEASNFPE